jgi:hypothetical protein
MTSQIDGRIKELCGLIGTEQDRRKFLELVNELNRLLEAKDQAEDQAEDQKLKLSSQDHTLPTTPA